MAEALLRFSISKKYQGFSLECEARFEAGITGVFGHSGSGKTTLLNCISGLSDPDKGYVCALGESLYSSSENVNIPPEQRQFGYMSQEASLFPHLNVEDNILYGYKLTQPRRRRIQPDKLIDLFNLNHLTRRSIRNLSGGERQRVALARALATSPKLLLLDEPLASVDMRMRGLIIRYLKRVWRELGTPMVFVSHSISEVLCLVGEVLVLREGRAVIQASALQALVHPDTRALPEYQALENIIEATICDDINLAGLSRIRVGDSYIVVPELPGRDGEVITVSIRAGDIMLALDKPSRISAQNILRGVVEEVHTVASRVLVYVDVGTRLVVEVTPSALQSLRLTTGREIFAVIKSSSIVMLEPSSPNQC